jgi:hypothetical protein
VRCPTTLRCVARLASFIIHLHLYSITQAINITTTPTTAPAITNTTTTMSTFEAPTSMRRKVCSKYLAKQCTGGECHEGSHPVELDPHKKPEERTPSATEKSISSSCRCNRCISKGIKVMSFRSAYLKLPY